MSKEFKEAKRLFLLRGELMNKFAREMNLSSEAWAELRKCEIYKLSEKIHKAGKGYECSPEECKFIRHCDNEFETAYAKRKPENEYSSREMCLEILCRDKINKLNAKYPRVEDVKSVKEEKVKEESLYLNEVSIKDTLDYLNNLKKVDFDSLVKEGLVSIVNDEIIIVTDKYFRDGKCLLSKLETEEAFVLEKELTTKYVEMKFVKTYFDPQENLINKARDIRRKMKESTDTVELSELTIELNNVYDELSRLNKEINKYVR